MLQALADRAREIGRPGDGEAEAIRNRFGGNFCSQRDIVHIHEVPPQGLDIDLGPVCIRFGVKQHHDFLDRGECALARFDWKPKLRAANFRSVLAVVHARSMPFWNLLRICRKGRQDKHGGKKASDHRRLRLLSEVRLARPPWLAT
jgi:hypothetical protein